jgi:hypothetical protein
MILDQLDHPVTLDLLKESKDAPAFIHALSLSFIDEVTSNDDPEMAENLVKLRAKRDESQAELNELTGMSDTQRIAKGGELRDKIIAELEGELLEARLIANKAEGFLPGIKAWCPPEGYETIKADYIGLVELASNIPSTIELALRKVRAEFAKDFYVARINELTDTIRLCEAGIKYAERVSQKRSADLAALEKSLRPLMSEGDERW